MQDDIYRNCSGGVRQRPNERFAGTVTIRAEGQLDSTGRTIDGTLCLTWLAQWRIYRRRSGNDSR
jgi:hypothetical protein